MLVSYLTNDGEANEPRHTRWVAHEAVVRTLR